MRFTLFQSIVFFREIFDIRNGNKDTTDTDFWQSVSFSGQREISMLLVP